MILTYVQVSKVFSALTFGVCKRFATPDTLHHSWMVCGRPDITWRRGGSWMRSKVLPSKIWFRCQSLLAVWLGNWLQEVAAKSAAQTLKVRGHGNGNRSVEFLGYMSHRDKKHIGKDTPSSFTKHLGNIEQSWQHNFSSRFFNFPIQLHWRLQLLQWRSFDNGPLELNLQSDILLGEGGFGKVWRARDREFLRLTTEDLVPRSDAGKHE